MLALKPKEVSDFQFCSPRLVELYYQEIDYFDSITGFEYKVSYVLMVSIPTFTNMLQKSAFRFRYLSFT
jgi:hypothetical protein